MKKCFRKLSYRLIVYNLNNLIGDHQIDLIELRTMLKNPKILKACQDILNKKQVSGPRIVFKIGDNSDSPILKDILEPMEKSTQPSTTTTTTTTTTTISIPVITERRLMNNPNSKLDRRKQMRNRFRNRSDHLEMGIINRTSDRPKLEDFNFG